MGKRTKQNFVRSPRDYYGTVDPDALSNLQKLVSKETKIYEPCSGNNHLVNLLRSSGYDVVGHSTIEEGKDATTLVEEDLNGATVFITNPPFSWPLLQPLLDHLPTILPTVMLLPADVMHNKRMAPYMEKCMAVSSIGRLFWVEDKPIKGVDNYAWFLFTDSIQPTYFFGRN